MTKRLERKISVDVSNMTIEQKKRVQDCFFKLGYKWHVYGTTHKFLDTNQYTNTDSSGFLDNNLMFSDYTSDFSVPPITLEELEQITAEFTGENNMKEQQFKLGGVYKCGESYVRIIADLSGDDKHSSDFFNLVGIHCDEDGKSLSCDTGMFTDKIEGEWLHYTNPERLNHNLERITKEPSLVELTLQQVADKLGVPVESLRIKG